MELGQNMPIERPNLPFQVVETINKAGLKDRLLVDNRLLKISVKPVINVSAERLDFDTQKPKGFLQILIMATTDPGAIDDYFFCGSDTILALAEKLGRRWIGYDLSKFVIQVTRKRLLDIPNSKDLTEDER